MAATPFTPALRAQYFARWPFDLINFNGTADDTSGNGHTLNINATFPSPSTVCQSAGCYQFNGQNQSANVALDFSGTSAVTVAFWLNWNAYANDDRLAMEFTSTFTNKTTGFIIDPNSGTVPGKFEVGLLGNAGYNQVNFDRPSA